MAKSWRERLTERIAQLGLSKAEVNRKAGVGVTVVHDIFNKDASPSVDNFARIADALGLNMTDLYYGDNLLKLHFHVSGTADEGAMWSQLPPAQQRVFPIEFSTEDLITLQVNDASYEPRFSRGDLLIGLRQAGTHLDNLIGLECIAQTSDGQRYVRILARGSRSGVYTLRARDPREADAPDVTLAWAAPIRMVVRGPH